MGTTETFWLGVTSGLVTALLIAVFKGLLGRTISMVAGLFTRSVAGKWRIRFWKGEKSFEESAEMYQVLRWVWGAISYPNKGREYKVRGTLRSNILVAIYEVMGNRSTVDRGAFTLNLNSTGQVREMKGMYSWTDDESSVPKADRYEWYKI